MAKLIPFLPLFDQTPEPESTPQPEPQQSTPSSPPPPDAAARAEALDIQRSFIVEAPAGSGKTGLLIQRYLRLLTDPSVTSPAQVLAITFTNAAAAEMRDRVLAQLEAAAQNTPVTEDFARTTRELALAVLTRDREFNWDLLDQPHRLNLRTIDSVCAEITRSLPILSGSAGGLSPSDDARPLYREAARRTLLLLGTQHSTPSLDSAIRDLLLHRDGNLADCESLLADMLAWREQWGTLVPLTDPALSDERLDREVLPQLERTLALAISSELARLLRLVDLDLRDFLLQLTDLAAELATLDGYNGKASPIAICASLTSPPEDHATHLPRWRAFVHLLIAPSNGEWRKGFNSNHVGFVAEKHHKDRLKSLIDQVRDRDDLLAALCRINALPPAQYPPTQWAVAKSLFRVLARALVELELVFSARGQCDFTELTLRAGAALGSETGPEDLASALGARLQHLLVDEMQDTSAAHYRLIERLTASWDGHSQTVFLVGDPRQSIYLFRQARVESFLETLHSRRLGDLPLTPLRLTANFRSQQSLVAEFNRDFSLVFPTGDALPYAEADAVLPPSPTARGLVWHARPVPLIDRASFTGPSSEATRRNAEERLRQARRNAGAIRRIAREWLARPLPAGRTEPWRIAVLVRNRNHLTEIVTALELIRHTAEPVPYKAVEITPLNERQEILDLTALTRALLHPADRVAALAVLRAPWCGLSLADLHTLTGSDAPGLRHLSIQRLLAERGELLSPESIERITCVWTVLSTAARQRARLTTAQLVERAWRTLGGDAWLSEPERINARRFFELIDELEATGAGIDTTRLPTQLEDRLRYLYAEPDPIPEGTPHLELLTIHRAKGLEWDVVFVPALERGPAISGGRLLTWTELDGIDSDDGATPMMLAPIAARGEEVDPLTAWLKLLHREREAAERKRLFYVAATRARQELHLFAAPDLLANGSLNPRWDSLLKSAWDAAEPHVAEAVARITPPPQISAEVVAFPAPAEPLILNRLAAVADTSDDEATAEEEAALPRILLKRVPATFDPAAALAAAAAHHLPYGDAVSPILTTEDPDAQPAFTRPEGSLAARAFGNTVHALLELLTTRAATGATTGSLLAELTSWTPRITALLRAEGLAPATVERLTRETRAALDRTLRDPDGQWILGTAGILANHSISETELALTAATPELPHASPISIRADRIFHAGPEPHIPGDTFLWIVDYKTASHSPAGLDDFLIRQRQAYASQLETYARVLSQARSVPLAQIRLALYYPTLPRLLWWAASE